MIRKTRSLAATAGALGTVALLTVAGPALGAKASKGKADSGTSQVAITHSSGGYQYSAGNNTDKLLGTGAVTYQVKLTPTTPGTYKLTAKRVVVYTGTGSLVGTGSATLNVISASGNATVTNGKLSLTKGFGSQKGHSETATFTGTGTITGGVFTFQYKGTYR
jgi:hypothetical protein